MRCVRLVLLGILAVGFGLVLRPPAVAAAPHGPVETPGVTVGDSDGDGLAEASVSGGAGGPCACWCPVIGGDAQAEVAGQMATTDGRSTVVLCGTRSGVAIDPNAPDASDAPQAVGRLRFNPGGFVPRR